MSTPSKLSPEEQDYPVNTTMDIQEINFSQIVTFIEKLLRLGTG